MISKEAFAFGTSRVPGFILSRTETRGKIQDDLSLQKGLEINRSFSSPLTSLSDLKYCGKEVFTFVKLHAGDPWWKGHLIDVLRIIQISNYHERKCGILYRPLRVPALAPTI